MNEVTNYCVLSSLVKLRTMTEKTILQIKYTSTPRYDISILQNRIRLRRNFQIYIQ